MDKIREKEQGEARAAGVEGDDEDEEDGMPRLPPKVGRTLYCRVCCCRGKKCARRIFDVFFFLFLCFHLLVFVCKIVMFIFFFVAIYCGDNDQAGPTFFTACCVFLLSFFHVMFCWILFL